MTTFDDREKAYEGKYIHEEKVSFDIEARTCKIFGLWIAEKLGLTDENATTYAIEVVEANLEEPGFEDVLRKVRADLSAKGVEYSDDDLKKKLDGALEEARRQMMEG